MVLPYSQAEISSLEVTVDSCKVKYKIENHLPLSTNKEMNEMSGIITRKDVVLSLVGIVPHFGKFDTSIEF